MIASLILGLPLPPVTCYLILAILAAPALVKAGVIPMASHLFVFFFGALVTSALRWRPLLLPLRASPKPTL